MHKNLFIVFFLLSLVCSSCNSLLDKPYNAQTYREDIESIRQSNKIDEEDIDLLTKYMIVSKLSGNDLQGKTYNDILTKIKEIRKATGEHNNRLQEEQLLKRERLNNFVSVKLTEKIFTKVNKIDCFIYTVNFKNVTSKNLKMVVGSIAINDLLDKQIKKIDILLDEEIKANTVLQKKFTVMYDHGNENDKRIRTKDLMDLRVEWNPEKIIFSDGKILD